MGRSKGHFGVSMVTHSRRGERIQRARQAQTAKTQTRLWDKAAEWNLTGPQLEYFLTYGHLPPKWDP